jgi:tetratricopeptide (TPR) repeat protein
MKKLLLIFFLFCGTLPCYSQDITRQQADQLLNTIRQQGTDTTHIHALLTLAEFNIFKKGELKTDLDSARLFTDQAKAMNSKVKSITAYGYTALVESYLARETKHEDVAKVLNDKAIQILNDAKNYNHLGQAYFQRATYYNPYDDSGSSIVIDLYYKGIAAYKQINNIERQAYGFKRLGEFSSTVKGTMENLEKSLELYKSIHYGAIQEVYDLMAVAYMYDLNIQKALPYALLALKVAEQQKDTTMQLCAINNHIGLLYDKKKDYTNAALYFKKALKTAEYYKDVNTVYFLSNNIINCYIALKSASPAKKLLERLLKKFPITDDNLPLTRIATALFVKIYTLSNDIKTGEIYTERLQQLDERHRSSLNDAN